MSVTFAEGERVRIVDREATNEDMKSGLFYSHLRNLEGVVQKVYENSDVVVELDVEKLPEEVAKRHIEIQNAMKQKWMDGLSDDAKNRLTPKEREFRLRYTVLVASKDLTKEP